jgi:hypothetical protein
LSRIFQRLRRWRPASSCRRMLSRIQFLKSWISSHIANATGLANETRRRSVDANVCCWHFSDMPGRPDDVCFSNRPFGVKHFQTIHLCGVDVTRGLVLLFGIGTWGPSSMGSEDEAEQSVGRPCRQCETAGPSGHTNSPHPSSREGHLSTARWSSSFLLSGLVLNCFMPLLPRLSPGSTGTLCRQPRCGA